MQLIQYYDNLISWLKKHLSSRQFLVISSIMVGLTAGLAAVLLKTVVHYIQIFLSRDYYNQYQKYFFLILPIIGILLTVGYIRIFLKDNFGRGTGHILHTISRKSSLVEKKNMYSHIVTSALTVGFGGSVGLEAPIVVTGSAIGSNYGRINKLNYRERTLLLASGAAAGIAAVFNAPIAGVMFALEVLVPEVTISAFIPFIIASATGALCSKIILQEEILFFIIVKEPFNYYNIPLYILLGIFTGLFSVYYARTFRKVENILDYFKHKGFIKVAIGGVLLGFIIFLFPPLYGEGYESIKLLATGKAGDLLQNSLFENLSSNKWFVIMFIGLVAFVKVVATSLTLGSGGNGGNFAPSLFVGGFLGNFFAKLFNQISAYQVPETNFTIVGMAGILTGVMYAPLTGIFLIAEITGGYDLMIPLMIVSAFTYAIVRHFEPYSMDTRDLAHKGHLLTSNKDKNVLTLLNISEIIESDFKTLRSNASFVELTDIIAHSKRNIFPVVDMENNLLGIITLESIREILFELDEYKEVLAIELMSKPPAVISMDETMSSVMKKFDETGAWNLPVVNNGKYVGFVSRSSLLTKYRNQIIITSMDE